MAFLNYHGLQTFKEKENEQIAPVEKAAVASRSYAIGERFWFDGNLCKATAAITAGASIVLGTNCVHSPMSDMKELPEVSSSDNGKVLSVVGGEWEKANMPSGNLPVVSDADNGKVLGVVEGEWAVKDDEGGSLPDVTAADNGRLLGVVNGGWGVVPSQPGESGKVLTSDGEGGLVWGAGADPEVIDEAVSDWLDEHPEATTTVADGSITIAKLDANLQDTIAVVDPLADLKIDTIPFTIVGSGYIKFDSPGDTGVSSLSSYTDYIDLSRYKKIYYKRGGFTSSSISSGMAFYDDQYTYIIGLSNLGGQGSQAYLSELCEKDVPENAKYARFTTFTDTTTYGDFEIYGDLIIVDKIAGTNDKLGDYLLDKYTWVTPDNLLNRNAVTVGELKADGSTLSTSDRCYTDYIPVTPGDRVYFIRTDTHGTPYRRHVCCYDEYKNLVPSAGTDSATTSSFLVQAGIRYVRLTLDKNIVLNYDTVIALNVEDVSTVKFSSYFDPYQVLTEDFLTPESQAVVSGLVNKTLKSDNLANKYACAVPRSRALRMTVGLPESWYNSAMFNLPSTYGYAIAGQQYTSFYDDRVYFPNNEAVDATNGFSWYYFDAFGSLIDSYTGTVGLGGSRKIVAESLSDCSMIVIGDSKTDQGIITATLLSHFTEQGHTITLMGTRSESDPLNRHEGRAGWSTADYYTSGRGGVSNPFYNPDTQTFDFTYYMTQQGYTTPDFVVIELGVNDLYNAGDSEIVPTYERLRGMFLSVHEYASSIKVLLVLPTQPNIDQHEMSVFRPTYISRVIRYNAYVLNQTLSYSTSWLRPTYCHLVIDPKTDVSDNVHPTNAGYRKMALEIVNQVNCWQNGA